MQPQKSNNVINWFPIVVLASIFLVGTVVYIFHLFKLVTAKNEVYVRFGALILFVVGFVILGFQKAKKHRFSWGDLYKNTTLISVALTILLVSSFLYVRVGFYAVGFCVAAVLFYLFYNRKFYSLPRFFYFVIVYALLLVFGTIGTKQGFHFPDRLIPYFVLPLLLCFCRLSRENLFRIAEMFFKASIIFLAVCVLYWWYNFLHLDADFLSWITQKNGYFVEMIGWEEQAKKYDSLNYYSAFFFVTSWSGYYHPSFVSFILFFGLILGFYLFYKKNEIQAITKIELALYIALCLFVILLLESRIGVVGFLFIIAATGLYYLKLKKRYFKIGLAVYLVLACLVLSMFNDKISGFVNDDVRDAYQDIAVSYIQENFWWGSGFRQQQMVLEQQVEKMKDMLPEYVYPHNNHPIYYVHNQFLGDMVQFGILGLMALLAMLVAITYYAVKNRSYLLQMFLSVLVLFMMIEEPFYSQAATIHILTFLVFFTALSKNTEEKINT